jgi:DNA-binding CsgD family transcriptional regulator/PAS domain-containing protein
VGRVDVERLNEVAERLGEAVIDPGRWPLLMEDICSAVSTKGAALLQSDVRTPEIPRTPSVDQYFNSYFENNLHIVDIRASRGVPLLLAGRSIITDQSLFATEREMMQDPLYAHAANWKLRWWAGIGFFAGTALWALALQRTSQEGPFEPSEMEALAFLPARLTETATLSKAVGHQMLLASTNVLDLVQKPAIALDRQGRVLELNPAASKILDDEIRVSNKRLLFRDRDANLALETFIDRSRSASDASPLSVDPIIVRRKTSAPVVIQVLPVDGAACSPFLGARAILVFTDLGLARNVKPKLLRRIYKLTPAEARPTPLIAAGASPAAAAEEVGIARETARNQLKSIYAKTDTHRQGELASLLSRL